MDEKEPGKKVTVCTILTSQQKQILVCRAQSLGLTLSAFLRTLILNPKRTAEEILAREWVSVALQIQKLQSDEDTKAEIQGILEQLKLLIQKTTSGQITDPENQ